jgi:hypothetical protein
MSHLIVVPAAPPPPASLLFLMMLSLLLLLLPECRRGNVAERAATWKRSGSDLASRVPRLGDQTVTAASIRQSAARGRAAAAAAAARSLAGLLLTGGGEKRESTLTLAWYAHVGVVAAAAVPGPLLGSAAEVGREVATRRCWVRCVGTFDRFQIRVCSRRCRRSRR